MEEKNISPEESLELINRMVAISQEKLQNSGFHFILWGVLVSLGSLGHYAMNKFDLFTFKPYIIWPTISFLGIPIAFLYEHKKTRKSISRSKFDRIYMYLWFGFAVTLVLTIFISISNNILPIPSILALTGLAVFVSSFIYRWRSLLFGSFVLWIGALLCLKFDANEQLLINAVALVLGYIIPGILFWKKNV